MTIGDFFEEIQAQADEEAELMRVPAVTLRNTTPFTDEDPMMFGKYKGSPIKDVPAKYLLWWFDQGSQHCPQLTAYIAKNKKQLEEEAEVLSGHHSSGVDNDWDRRGRYLDREDEDYE